MCGIVGILHPPRRRPSEDTVRLLDSMASGKHLKRRDLQPRETRGRPEHSQGGTEGHSGTEVLIEALAPWALLLSPKSGPHERQERRTYVPTKHLMPLTAGFQIEGAEKQVSLCLAQSQRLPEAESR